VTWVNGVTMSLASVFHARLELMDPDVPRNVSVQATERLCVFIPPGNAFATLIGKNNCHHCQNFLKFLSFYRYGNTCELNCPFGHVDGTCHTQPIDGPEPCICKESLLQYMESVHSGIKGEVIDAETGNYVQNARVKIRGNGKVIRTTRDGEFWRLLVPGEHVLTVSANGYESSEPLQISVGRNNVVYHKVVLNRQR